MQLPVVHEPFFQPVNALQSACTLHLYWQEPHLDAHPPFVLDFGVHFVGMQRLASSSVHVDSIAPVNVLHFLMMHTEWLKLGYMMPSASHAQ